MTSADVGRALLARQAVKCEMNELGLMINFIILIGRSTATAVACARAAAVSSVRLSIERPTGSSIK
jgi:hypothetical protein